MIATGNTLSIFPYIFCIWEILAQLKSVMSGQTKDLVSSKLGMGLPYGNIPMTSKKNPIDYQHLLACATPRPLYAVVYRYLLVRF